MASLSSNPHHITQNFPHFRERLEEREQQNLAIMLMVVVMIFVLCNVLAMLSNILDMLDFKAAALTKVFGYVTDSIKKTRPGYNIRLY